jgi:hypothetical protein
MKAQRQQAHEIRRKNDALKRKNSGGTLEDAAGGKNEI